MRTVMGRDIDLLNPAPDQICVFDIAHGLAHQGRFAGHTRKFYSVAEHCVLASHLVERGFELDALLHDAPETSLGDLIAPVKHLTPQYKSIEGRFEAAYESIFPINFNHPAVKQADQQAYALECSQLRPRSDCSRSFPDQKIKCWSPTRARKAFLRRYFVLRGDSQFAAWWKERTLTLKFYLQQDFAPVR